MSARAPDAKTSYRLGRIVGETVQRFPSSLNVTEASARLRHSAAASRAFGAKVDHLQEVFVYRQIVGEFGVEGRDECAPLLDRNA